MDQLRRSFTTLTTDPGIQALLDHPGTHALTKALGTDWVALSGFLLGMLDRPDTIHLKSDAGAASFSMAEIFHLLYSYILNRATAIAIIESESYIIRDSYESKTDAAFSDFLRTLIEASHEPKTSSTTSAMAMAIDGSTTKAYTAFKIFTNQPSSSECRYRWTRCCNRKRPQSFGSRHQQRDLEHGMRSGST